MKESRDTENQQGRGEDSELNKEQADRLVEQAAADSWLKEVPINRAQIRP